MGSISWHQPRILPGLYGIVRGLVKDGRELSLPLQGLQKHKRHHLGAMGVWRAQFSGDVEMLDKLLGCSKPVV